MLAVLNDAGQAGAGKKGRRENACMGADGGKGFDIPNKSAHRPGMLGENGTGKTTFIRMLP